MDRLTKRAEFVDVARGARLHKGAFSLQAKRRRLPAGRDDGGPVGSDAPRFGFTVTKKTGNAVERNRIRRRLKAAVADVHAETATGIAAGVDYVLIGRRPALSISYHQLQDDMRRALRTIDPDRRSSSAARRAQPHTRG